jgi:SAM-dependent methyltransferase
MESYEGLAAIYDQLMVRDVDYERWADYLWDLICEVRQASVEGLEMAAGTGNLTEKLIQKNCHLDAFDRSEDMLMTAREKNLPLRDVSFYQQDMVTFRFAKAYDFVVCACDSINYLVRDGEIERVFSRVFEHLKAGGVFVFDVVTIYRMAELYGNETFVVDQDEIYYVWKNRWRPERGIIDYEITFFAQDGDCYERFDEVHRQRGYSLQEIKAALVQAGFENIQAFNAFSKDPVGEKSERVQWRAVKGE